MDPGSKEIQNHLKSVIRDIVTRYDIDGLHYDDYFYERVFKAKLFFWHFLLRPIENSWKPYASYNDGADFPDSKTYNEYRNQGGTMSKGDWRRDNVNHMIQSSYDIIKGKADH